MRRKTELTGATTGWLAGPHAALMAARTGCHRRRRGCLKHGVSRRACGHTLRRIHAIDVTTVFGGEPTPPGTVLVHGDYGPNNILLDPDTLAVTAVLDWEWAHPGDPLEDLAWCEWIVRSYQHADGDRVQARRRQLAATEAWTE